MTNKRCGVHRAVVALTSTEHAAAAPMPELVDDLAGLFFRYRVVLRSLEIGECEEHAARQIGIERQCHQRREQRVAAEQGHEPRSASRSQRPIGVLLVDDAQRSEVGERPVDRRTEARVGGDHRRRPLPPSGHAVDGDCLGRWIERRRRRPRSPEESAAIDADADRRRSPRGQLEVPAQRSGCRVSSSRLSPAHTRRHVDVVEIDGEHQPAVVVGDDLSRSPVLATLDVEHMGEVGGELHVEVDRPWAESTSGAPRSRRACHRRSTGGGSSGTTSGRPRSGSTRRCTITAARGLGDVLVSVSRARPRTVTRNLER